MTAEFPAAGRLAGIDYGTVRIGVALCDPGRRLASPHANFTRGDKAAEERFFRDLVREESVVAFVVGLPVHLSGNESQKSREAREFGEWLGQLTSLPIAYFDERFSTAEAEHALAEGKLTSKQRKARRDMLAAQVMLAAFLESKSPHEPPRGLDG